MIWLIPAIYLIEWWMFVFIQDTWDLLLGTKYLAVSVLAWILVSYSCNDTLFKRSLILLYAIDTTADVIRYISWQSSSKDFDLILHEVFIFIIWFIFIIIRDYEYKSDEINMENINIIAIKPKSNIDVLKGLIGLPASSICIATFDSIWAFNRKTGMFSERKYQHYNDRIIIDTGIKCTDEILNELNKIVGTKRYPYIKCIWSIRHVLNMLGTKYSINYWFDYIPGIYLMKIIK